MSEGLFDEPGRELDTGPVDEVETSMADLVMPISISPDRMTPADLPAVLDEIDALRTLRASVEAREFALIGHAVTIAPSAHPQRALPGGEQRLDLGGDGCPDVPEFAILEVAALLHTSHTAARGLVADALSVRWRHPRMWRAVMAGRLPVWQARKVAQAVRVAGLDRAAALRVDRAVEPGLGTLSWPRLEALVEGEIVAADPARAAAAEERARCGRFARVARDERGHAGVRTMIARLGTPEALQLDATLGRLATALARQGDEDDLDVRRARALGILATPERALALLAGDDRAATRLKPPVRLYAHVNADRLGPEGVVRLEGEGAVPVAALRDLLKDSHVRLTAVIDHRNSEPIDAYEIPERMREQVVLANPYEVFPWGTRRARHADQDHTTPFSAGGQTRVENLAPLGRTGHRAKTHAGWRCRQVAPGHWLWRSPVGREYEVDNWGTRPPTDLAAIASVTEQQVIGRITDTPPPPRATRTRRKRRRRAARDRQASKRRPHNHPGGRTSHR